jgi:hypothetical protein
VGPLQVKIRSAAQPAKVTLEPGGQPLSFNYHDGEVNLTVARLDLHRIIVIE